MKQMENIYEQPSMEQINNIYEQELQKLKQIKKAAERDIKNAPPGTLRIAKNHNTDQYYWRTDPKDTRGNYIKKREEKLIKGLAQKDYAQKVLSILNPMIKKKEEMIQTEDASFLLREMYDELSPARRKLIVPYVENKEEFARKWEEKQNQIKEKVHGNFLNADTEIYTEKGECVRSKSEKILADKFYLMKIPYVYEAPLHLQGYGYVHPDFTVLNKNTQQTYYWEHLGMMDDKEYCEKAIRKIETYAKSGIFPGRNLLLTFETKELPLNIKNVEGVIENFLI